MKSKIILILIILLISIQFSLSDTTIPDICYKGNINTTTNECICTESYTTYPEDSKEKCNYQLRSDKIARFLSIFGGILGADMFYLGYNYKAIFKCVFPLLILIFIIHMNSNNYLNNYKYK